MRLRFWSLAVVLALTAPGCLGNFDPALYAAGAQPLSLGDDCRIAAAVPTLPRTSPDDATTPLTASYLIDTRGLASDVNDEVTTCTGQSQTGNDGFLRIHMNADERWHFHIRHPDNAMSPSIYVLDDGCDARTCAGGAGLDLCGASADEHFTFTAPRAGDYFVGIDADGLGTDGMGGFAAQLDIIHPVCGDGTRQHSEGCDNGPDVDGDDCDALCRKLIPSGGDEVEANDDVYAANHLVLGDVVTTVNGAIATACESDIYAFVVEGAAMDATIELGLQAGGCPGASAMPLSIDLLGANGSSVISHVDADGTTCPMITATGLAPNTYFIRIRSVAPGVSRNVPYRITFTDATP
jgi:cysteine-rich repeat protein